MDPLEVVQTLVAVTGGIAAIVALWQSLIEYKRQGAQKRAEYFLEMRKRLKENPSYKTICALIETDDPSLSTLPFEEKRDFLGFFEEVALMSSSGLIRKDVVHYMFGYYAIRCWRSEHFWHDVNRESIYWALFRDFVRQMEQAEASFQSQPYKYKF